MQQFPQSDMGDRFHNAQPFYCITGKKNIFKNKEVKVSKIIQEASFCAVNMSCPLGAVNM